MNGHSKTLFSAKAGLRDRIVATAIDAFTKNGIKTITMDDIANKLAISKRTLYETFKDKEDLLVECVQHQHREMEDFMVQVARKSDNVLEVILKFYKRSIEIFHKTNKRFFEDMNKYPRVCSLIKRNREESSRESVAFFKKGIDQGIFRDDVNFEILHLMIREQVDLLLTTALCRAYSFVEVFESIMFVYMRGICTEKGQKILENFITEYKQQKKN